VSFFASLLAGFRYLGWELWDDIKLVIRYYRKPRYAIADTWLQCRYFFTPVAQLCRWALRHYADDQVQRIYGETSIVHFATLCAQLALTEQDCFYELGCGRGRLALWLALHTPCKQVVGIDLNPIFIERADQITRRLRIKNLRWQRINMIDADLTSATVIYLYGTAFNEQGIQHLSAHLSTCREGTRIITVSYPLENPAFELLQTLTLQFVWGEADVFIQKRLA
jgi:SAM-dependent methyltransferase